MKLKTAILILAMATPLKEYAQTEINRTIPVNSGESISMHFDYPKLIEVSTWEGKDVVIQGQVSINGGENDAAFILENTRSGNVVSIRSSIKDMKSLPQRVTVVRDGQKMIFRDKAELQKYQAQNGTGYNMMSWGPDIEIHMVIKVPRNVSTSITSVYGMVEVKNFSGPLTVDATYGGVDAALMERSVGELTAETNYGQIYTDLDIKFGSDKITSKDFYLSVSAKPGQGPKYNFESKYGNVYLRKASGN
jgi:hypothetical protein